MKDLLLIFFGGGLGSLSRFYLGQNVNLLHEQAFPWGTLVVNTVACFLLGFVIGLADQKQLISPAARIFWTVGFCGGFSTFSTFSHETLSLMHSGNTGSLILYILSSIIICLSATYGGLLCGESL